MSSRSRRAKRPDYDQALKRLLARDRDGFLALVAPGFRWRAERSPELPAVARRADLVWEVERPTGWRGILHVELQTKVEADIGERVADVRLWRRDHLPLRSVVVFLREAKTTPAPPFVIPWEAGESLLANYHVVRLWEVPQERVLGTPHYALWPLASLMADVTAESTLAVADRILQAPLPEEDRRELTGLLLVLAGSRLTPAVVLETLRRNRMLEDLLKDNSVAQILIEEGGRRVARRMALVALVGRFGPLSEDVSAAVGAADEATLEAVVAHIASDTLEEMRARLGLA